VAEGRAEEAGVFVGEAIGLMNTVDPAGAIIDRVIAEASRLLGERGPGFVT
jgi:nitronate monooxygenase